MVAYTRPEPLHFGQVVPGSRNPPGFLPVPLQSGQVVVAQCEAASAWVRQGLPHFGQA